MLINLIQSLGYLGIFIVSLISTSTLFLPFPLYSIISVSTFLGMNPLLVSFISGLGMTIGEFTGYLVGSGSERLISKKHKKLIKNFEKFFKKFGFLTISLAAFLPFPFDIVGILAGMGKYNIKRFFLATFVGKFLKALLIAYAGFFAKEILNIYYL